MPNFVADIWRATTPLSTGKAGDSPCFRAGMNAPLKRADCNLPGPYSYSQPAPAPLNIQPFLLLKG